MWIRSLPLLLTTVLTAQAPAPVTPEQRDEAIVKAMRHLDKNLWQLSEHGSPRKQFSLGVAGWAYLLAADKPAAGRSKLPSRKKQLDRIRSELTRYAERVVRLYKRDDRKERRNKRKKRKPAARGGMPDFEAMQTSQYVWSLSMAAHFFAESAARGKAKGAAKKALQAIVKVLESSQQQNGGWGHDDASRPGMGLPKIRIPKPGGGQLDYPGTLLAASHCALSGLGNALDQLRRKKAKRPSIVKGLDYFAASQNGNGTFPYDPKQKHGVQFSGAMAGGIEVARTAGAVFALFCAGVASDDERARKALDAIDESPDLVSEGHGSASMALMFGALLAKARGERAWATFRRIFFPRILTAQQADGEFLCACKHKSGAVTCDTKPLPGVGSMPGMGDYVTQQKTYVTAIHTLILLLDRAAVRAAPQIPGPKAVVTGGK